MAPYVRDSDSLSGVDDTIPSSRGAPSVIDIVKAHREPLDFVQNLTQILTRASTTSGSLTFYSAENGELRPSRVSYSELLTEAGEKARMIGRIQGLSPTSNLLLHFDTQWETIQWFWAATLAGYLPAISTTFVNDATQRKKHLLHLQDLLEKPVVLTSKRLVPDFLRLDELNVNDVESLEAPVPAEDTKPKFAGLDKAPQDIAVLMLTSGSTGNAKAVPLRHAQLRTAIKGKSAHHGTVTGDVFLNWIGMDHVASFTEIHLHAMGLGCDQIHAPASELLRDPLQFLRLLSSHKVTYTFGPNFFLTKIRDSLTANPNFTTDLSSLRAFISGGESNVVATCDALTQNLRRFGIANEVVRPGFGMTETCAGSIYSHACPSHDIARGFEFASLGSCIPGIEMRVMSVTDPGKQLVNGEVGHFQVSGPVVFDQYYNNKTATRESFTSDGWFITGDLAWIDDAGNLNMAGRTKDTIIVNGVKWSSTKLETAIEEEGIAGLVPSFTVAFPTRPAGSPTEDIGIVYAPAYSADDDRARFETAKSIAKTVGLMTGTKPKHLIPQPQSSLEKTSLGKISRSKVRAALEHGEYADAEREDQLLLERYRQSKWRSAETDMEKVVQKTLADLLEMPAEDISMDASIFDLGITSFNLILLKFMIQKATDAKVDIPMSVMLTEPNVGAIASSIAQLMSQPTVYTPIVPLQPHGSGTPLFCIHPGSGDIIVFIALAAHFSTRPVYALRTRGYNPDERLFTSIEETANTYAEHIRKTQPEGPYAIAGYSLGSTLAYEVAKVLESQGQQVKFLASIDYPPHIAHYVQNLNWIDVLLHIAFFLELIDEKTMVDITPHMHTLNREAALSHILAISDSERAAALAMNNERLALISDIAENFRINVETYEPVGTVECIDVFVADPPTYAARNRQDWRENKLARWADFSRTGAQFHDCPGIHAKMLNREYMNSFAKIFKAAMRRRGV